MTSAGVMLYMVIATSLGDDVGCSVEPRALRRVFCALRFPGKRYPRSLLRVFLFSLRDRGPLNENNRKDDPPAFFGVMSFGTICNVVQCTVFPEKGTSGHFLEFLIF